MLHFADLLSNNIDQVDLCSGCGPGPLHKHASFNRLAQPIANLCLADLHPANLSMALIGKLVTVSNFDGTENATAKRQRRNASKLGAEKNFKDSKSNETCHLKHRTYWPYFLNCLKLPLPCLCAHIPSRVLTTYLLNIFKSRMFSKL